MPIQIWRCGICGKEYIGTGAKERSEVCEAQGTPPQELQFGQEVRDLSGITVVVVNAKVVRAGDGSHIWCYQVRYPRRGPLFRRCSLHWTNRGRLATAEEYAERMQVMSQASLPLQG